MYPTFTPLRCQAGQVNPPRLASVIGSSYRLEKIHMLTTLKCHWLTRSDFAAAWSRCLPIWRAPGGSDDWRGILGRPIYTPSFSRRLAHRFAVKFIEDADRLIEKTESSDRTDIICALDVLSRMGALSATVRRKIMDSSATLPRSVCQILEDDANKEPNLSIGSRNSFDTIGSYYTWAFNVETEYWASQTGG